MRRGPYQIVGYDDAQAIDAALRLVGGQFALAARLVGMTPVKFKNTVNGRRWLKERWGHARRGRPPGSVPAPNLITLRGGELARKASRFGPEFAKRFLRMLPPGEQREVKEWLDAQSELSP